MYRMDGPPVESSVIGGTAQSVIVEGGGFREEIPRSSIREYDYPGNVHGNIGALLLGYGILNIAVALPNVDEWPEEERGPAYVGAAIPAVVGAGMLIWGLIVNQSAKSAVSDTNMAASLPTQETPARYRYWRHSEAVAPAPSSSAPPLTAEERPRERRPKSQRLRAGRSVLVPR